MMSGEGGRRGSGCIWQEGALFSTIFYFVVKKERVGRPKL